MRVYDPKYGYGMTVSACLWLGLFPLLQGGTYTRLTHDKWIIMIILTGVTLLCFLIDLIIHLRCAAIRRKAGVACEKPSRRGMIPLVLASALLLWIILSCLFSGYSPDVWLRGEAVRYEGLVSQLCYFTLFACFFFSRVSLKPVMLSAAVGVTAFFVIVLLQRNGGNPLGLYPSGRSYALNPEFQGTIGNIDMGTGYLVLLEGFFLWFFLDVVCGAWQSHRTGQAGTKSKSFSVWPFLLAAVSLIAVSLALYIILTMDVQFGIVTQAVLFLFTMLRFIPKKWRLPLLLFLVVIILIVVWFWPGQSGGIWELHEILHGRSRLSFGSNRIAVWAYSLRLTGDKPLLGGGSGTFASRFNRYLADHDLVIPEEQDGLLLPHYFDNPHNVYIAFLTDHGFPAALLFLALLLFAVFRSRSAWFPLLTPCSAAVLCYAVQAFFSFSVCIVAPMFWVVLGMSFKE